MNEKIQRYEELNTKRNKSPKDFDKLERLHNEQETLCQNQEVMNYVNERAYMA